MKILYISGGKGPDYQADALMHGLRSLLGEDLVDVNKMGFMYAGYDKKGLYGSGFTMYALLPELAIDRTDIEAKIRAKFFDFIIFGSIQRCQIYFGDALAHYPAERIVFIDGEDYPTYFTDCVNYGWYFKRELHQPQVKVHPIHFAIPAEKISTPLPKAKFMAHIDPIDTKTYIYQDEQSYYDDYRSSMFARTMKKAGFDCLRHYEILACGCIPYFRDLDGFPPMVMHQFPKKEVSVAGKILDFDWDLFSGPNGMALWENLHARMRRVLHEKLTTVALARYVLDTIGASCQTTTKNLERRQFPSLPEPQYSKEILSAGPQLVSM